MSALLEAAEFFDREAARSEGLARASAELKRVGGLVQAADEAEKRLVAIGEDSKAKLAVTEDAIAKAQERLTEINGEVVAAAGALERSNNQAREIVSAGRADARRLVDDAKRVAESTLTDARDSAADIIAAAKREAASFEPAIASGKDELAKLKVDIVTARSELDEVNALIDQARARFR